MNLCSFGLPSSSLIHPSPPHPILTSCTSSGLDFPTSVSLLIHFFGLLLGYISKTQILLWNLMWQRPCQNSTGSSLLYLNIAVVQILNLSPLSWFSFDIERFCAECCPPSSLNSSLAFKTLIWCYFLADPSYPVGCVPSHMCK